ncbi:AAA family ATPase [Oryzobacter sp. R7]|uniref:AAA family ATPase n=1 Tax=Oryzobacter faecalis TaxID=3388656 RepID=UPI00398D3EE8
MRLHRLEVEAFGPFADRVDLDLDALSSGGLFLVHGPTGAGKTSLLDAVCFALYADVPGARSKRGLRSDHAAPTAVPTVRLELTVGGRRLRIERSPEFQRPKKRGEGSTRVQARVVLEERRGTTWTALSTRNDEVADLVKDVVGLGLAQFARVVLLPQGDFATFLRATPEERREVLERLFDISVFSDVEAWLAQTRRTTGAALDEARRGLTTDLARLEDALSGVVDAPVGTGTDVPGAVDGAAPGEPVAPTPLSEVPVAAVPGRLVEVAEALDARLTVALADVDAAEGRERLAHEALVAATRLTDLQQRGARARARLAELADEAPDHGTRRSRLDAATRAASLAGHLGAVRRAEADTAGADATVAGHLARATTLGVPVDVPGAADTAARVHALDDVVHDLVTATRAATDLRERIEAAVTRRDGAEATVVSADAALADARPELEALELEAVRLAGVAERLPALELALSAHHGRLRAVAALEADLEALHMLQPRLQTARDAVLGHQDVLIRMRQSRLDGLAAELARSLEEGAPCPVCGALDHPRPAPAGDAATAEDVAGAEVVLDAARVELARVETRTAALEASAATRREALGDTTRAAVESDVAAAAQALADAGAEQQRSVEVLARLSELRDRLAQLTTRRDGAAATAASLEEQLAELTTEAAATAQVLDAAVTAHAGCPCGSADPAGHATSARTLDLLADAVAQQDEAAARYRAAVGDLEEAVGAAGFADVGEAAGATLPSADLDRLRRTVAAHDDALTAAAAVLEDPDVAEALATEPPDLAAAEEAARVARATAVASSTQREVLTRAVRVLTGLRPSLEASCADVAALEERDARVRDLADVAGGVGPDNTLKMRLTSFVLAARLEKVAALANERLAVMGGGRYLLEHTDERASGGARSGLGLRVLDQWTGRTRETASLSGGESFMASLALALGLADAVREEAGGHDLATLFVDEGFGSLDDDSLEQVLTVLDGLREGGRAVGVVSHVADLRARVPHQVVVHKGTDGSHVEVRVGAAADPAA